MKQNKDEHQKRAETTRQSVTNRAHARNGPKMNASMHFMRFLRVICDKKKRQKQGVQTPRTRSKSPNGTERMRISHIKAERERDARE